MRCISLSKVMNDLRILIENFGIRKLLQDEIDEYFFRDFQIHTNITFLNDNF